MRRLTIAFWLLVSVVVISTLARAQAPAAGRATVYEGARLIVGNGSAPIENAAFVVDAGKFTQVGRAGQVQVPAGATRVDLRGKTVIPAIVDTHVHMPTNREELITALQRKAYYGAGVVMSLGQDTGDVALQVRGELPSIRP
jgi:imidazolonepropionase-like amidohydrolase